MGKVAHDIVVLTELQAELLRVDAGEAAAMLLAPLVLLAVGGALALGTIPVLLLLVANTLVAAAGMADWLALLIAVALGLAASAATALAGWRALRAPVRAFQHSRDEFNRNIAWLKRTLARQTAAEPER